MSYKKVTNGVTSVWDPKQQAIYYSTAATASLALMATYRQTKLGVQ